jgi:hypothetical protein
MHACVLLLLRCPVAVNPLLLPMAANPKHHLHATINALTTWQLICCNVRWRSKRCKDD